MFEKLFRIKFRRLLDTLFKLTYVVISINHENMKRCLKSVLKFEFNAPYRKSANFCII